MVGDRDITEYSLGVGVTITSPLQIPPDQLDVYWQAAELETPSSVGSMPQAGSTAPASLVGTLILFTAEIMNFYVCWILFLIIIYFIYKVLHSTYVLIDLYSSHVINEKLDKKGK